ncbi:hypothetical protein [Thermococcus sp. Bubb.Bath]|uniref:hypothetical protein n=1 Tax=Thermococcus sp. Bubb.Bath TaxID=1638242 RepID=UPI00143BDA01|nr:hypothetical protein [Thermococcus sp. Bubb.Bath]NJF25840.1 hypothetical protein [Thermococcus sp. Bubb.Bath]
MKFKSPKRGFYSLVPLLFLILLLLPFGKGGLIMGALAIPGVIWFLSGTLYLILLAVFLIHANVEPLYSLTVFSLAFMIPVMGKLDREKATLTDYAVVAAATLLSLPTYLILRAISVTVSGIDATILAVLLLAALYFFIKGVGD